MIDRIKFFTAALLATGSLASTASASIIEVAFDVNLTPIRYYSSAKEQVDAEPNPRLGIDVEGAFTFDKDLLLSSPRPYNPGVFVLGGIVVPLQPGSSYGGVELTEIYATAIYAEYSEESRLSVCLMSTNFWPGTCEPDFKDHNFFITFSAMGNDFHAASLDRSAFETTFPIRHFWAADADPGEFSYSITKGVTDVPAPGSLGVLSLGFLGLAHFRQRRR